MYSQVKKNESALERIRGYHGQSSRKDRRVSNWKNAVEWKPIKFQKKKKNISKKKKKGKAR